MDIRKIITINELIKHHRTGKAKILANRLGVSERTAYSYLSFLKKELKAPIKWNSFKESYTYETNGELNFKWQEKNR